MVTFAGSAKTVEFDFDLASDTAMSVASEMVEEMSLSHGDAHKIAHAIKEEILSLTHKPLEEPAVDSHSEDGSFGHLSHADALRMEERLVRQESSGTRYEGAHCCSSQPSRTSLQQDRVADVAEQERDAEEERDAEVGELDRGAEVGEAVGQGAASPKVNTVDMFFDFLMAYPIDSCLEGKAAQSLCYHQCLGETRPGQDV